MEIKNKINMAINFYLESGLSMKKVACQFDIGLSTLQKYLAHQGLSRNNKENSRKYQANFNYFSNIDTQEKAYWLGFIYADGYISSGKQKNIGVALAMKDVDHLEKLKTNLNANYPIKTYKSISYGKEIEYARLLMTSDIMHQNLKEKGVCLQKSLILKFPNENIVHKDLINHFARGYFDGDGCLSKSSTGFTFKLCGTKEFLDKYKTWLGYPNHVLYKRNADQKNTFSLEIGGNLQVIDCCSKIYQQSGLHMERKFQRYLKIIQKYN